MTPEKVLNPVHPNVGLEVAYKKKLEALVDNMHKSIMWWVINAYKRDTPATVMALDDSSAIKLHKIIQKLTRYWHKNFNEAAKELAKYFANKNQSNAEGALKSILKSSGMAVEFKLTPAMRDTLQATIKQNVALITHMADNHLKEIEGITMRSVQAGGDLKYLSDQLESRYQMTRKRAKLIARDQNSKATASITRVRQVELGVKKAKWLHSHAGKTPRPTHMALNGTLYDVKQGAWDKDAEGKGKGAYVLPGELVNCRCVSRTIFPGITKGY
jgi:SPP1 gp7 family putative phage head morphogenesis protein